MFEFHFKKSYLSLIIGAAILTSQAQAAELNEAQKRFIPFLAQPKEAIGLSDDITAKYNGQGVAVGVVDSGFFNGHDLLKKDANLIPLPFNMTIKGKTYSFDPRELAIEVDQDSGNLKYNNHGGQVTGVIAASGQKSTLDPRLDYFGGVAKNATIYQVSYEPTSDPLPEDPQNKDKKLLLSKDPLSRMTFAEAINTLVVRAPTVAVINHSWNEDPVSDHVTDMDREYKGKLDLSNVLVKSLHNATDKGILQVFSAGNESKKQPGILAALPRYFPEMEKHYLSVIAVDGKHNLEEYSNHCGVSKNWCIATPGSMVLVAAKGDPKAEKVEYAFDIEQGTSFSAPSVTAAAALLKQRFDYMSIAQVRDVMLTTATDLGEKGVDDKFGWGMLNLGKAINGPTQLLGDESYTLNRDDSWSNSLSAGGRLTKLGTGKLTLAGDSNRLKAIHVADGGLNLVGETRLSESAVVERGELQLSNRLHAKSVQIKPQGNLSSSGIVDADTEISGTLTAQGMTFLKKLTLQDNAQFNLKTEQGISAQGKAAQVRLGGKVTVENFDFVGAKTAQLLELKDGASYHGSFAALIQSQALLKQGLRYDLQFTPSQVRLSVNPLNLTTKTANRNEANAVNALNQLRDSRLALSQNSYSKWLNHTLQTGDWQGLQSNLGNSIYANSISYLLDQAGSNHLSLHKHLSNSKSLKQGEWQVWSETGRDHSRYQANEIGKQVKYNAKQFALGVTKSLSEQAVIIATLAKNRVDVKQSNASADIDETRISVAGRYYPTIAKDWFIESDFSLAKIDYKQQRHFNAVAASSRGKTRGWNSSLALSAGYLWQQNNWSLEPSIGLQINRLALNSFHEHGSDLALASNKISKTETNLLLDLKFDRTFKVADWQVVPSVAVGYVQHLASRPVTVNSRLASVNIEQAATARQQGHLRTELALTMKYRAWQGSLSWQDSYQQEKGNKVSLNIGYRF